MALKRKRDNVFCVLSDNGMELPPHVEEIFRKLGLSSVQTIARVEMSDLAALENDVKTLLIDENFEKMSIVQKKALLGEIWASKPSQFRFTAAERIGIKAAIDICKNVVAANKQIMAGVNGEFRIAKIPCIEARIDPRSSGSPSDNTQSHPNRNGIGYNCVQCFLVIISRLMYCLHYAAGQRRPDNLDFPLGSLMFYVKRWMSRRKETFNLTMVDVESDEAIPSIFCRLCEKSVIVTSLNPGKWNISNFTRHLLASHLVVPAGKHFIFVFFFIFHALIFISLFRYLYFIVNANGFSCCTGSHGRIQRVGSGRIERPVIVIRKRRSTGL